MLIRRHINSVTEMTKGVVKYEGSAQIIFNNVHPNEIGELLNSYSNLDDDYGREEFNVEITREADYEYYGYFDTYRVVIKIPTCGGFSDEYDALQYVDKNLKRLGII